MGNLNSRRSFLSIMMEALGWGILLFAPLLLFAIEAGVFKVAAHQ